MTSLRNSARLRALARRLPVISAYERRIAELTDQVRADAEQISILDDVIAGRRAGPEYLRIFAPPGHFYSPYPDVPELRGREDAVFGADVTSLPAIDLRVDAQWKFLDEIAPLYRDVELASTREEAVARGERYWSLNPAYGDGDALALTAILRHLRPARLIELGCGYSSARTLDAWEHDLDRSTQLTFVDPYPQLLDSLLTDADRPHVTVLAERTQDVSLDLIRTLDEGDVLFIDSTHVAKTDSDVNRIFFEILPAVRPGVTIHLHDIFAGFEYPKEWVYEYRAWTEQYVLRSFLQYNDAFEILLWPTFLQRIDPDRHRAMFPGITNSGGAFWCRKVR